MWCEQRKSFQKWRQDKCLKCYRNAFSPIFKYFVIFAVPFYFFLFKLLCILYTRFGLYSSQFLAQTLTNSYIIRIVTYVLYFVYIFCILFIILRFLHRFALFCTSFSEHFSRLYYYCCSVQFSTESINS